MTIVIGFLHLVIIAYLTLLFYRKAPLQIKKFFIPGLLLKLLAGIIYGLIYKYYYGNGDTFNYFSDALMLVDLAVTSPIDYLQGLFINKFPVEIQHSLIFIHQPRALFLSKIGSVFGIITMGNYWICSLYFSMFSFLGFFYLLHVCSEKWPQQSKQIAIAFLFFPSVLFWSSGFNKESIAMGSLCFLVAIFLNLYFKKQRLNWRISIASFFCIYILWTLKYYYAAILLPILLSLLLVQLLSSYSKINMAGFRKFIVAAFIFVGLIILGSYLHPILTWHNFIQNLFDQHNAIAAISPKENLIQFNLSAPTLSGLINALPTALFSGLFRPAVWDANNFFQWCSALENLFLLLGTIIAIRNIKRLFQSPHQLLLWATILYILCMAALLALAAPNFGTLVRYKIGFLPFFVLLILLGTQLLGQKEHHLKQGEISL